MLLAKLVCVVEGFMVLVEWISFAYETAKFTLVEVWIMVKVNRFHIKVVVGRIEKFTFDQSHVDNRLYAIEYVLMLLRVYVLNANLLDITRKPLRRSSSNYNSSDVRSILGNGTEGHS